MEGEGVAIAVEGSSVSKEAATAAGDPEGGSHSSSRKFWALPGENKISWACCQRGVHVW